MAALSGHFAGGADGGGLRPAPAIPARGIRGHARRRDPLPGPERSYPEQHQGVGSRPGERGAAACASSGRGGGRQPLEGARHHGGGHQPPGPELGAWASTSDDSRMASPRLAAAWGTPSRPPSGHGCVSIGSWPTAIFGSSRSRSSPSAFRITWPSSRTSSFDPVADPEKARWRTSTPRDQQALCSTASVRRLPSCRRRRAVLRTSTLVAPLLFIWAVTITRASNAVNGTWSDFGPRMTHNQPSTAVGNPPIVVDRGYIYVSDRSGVNKMSLAAPKAWTYLTNDASRDRVGRLVVNALGNPLIGEKGKVVRVWNGSRFTESLFNPPAGSWYTMSAMAVDPASGDVYAAGNFTVYKSVNNGSSFGSISDLGAVCAGSNGDRRGWIYTIAVSPWRELFIGGETDAIYSSLDRGSTWSSLPRFPKAGNRYAVSPTKDGELLISTAFSDAGNDYFMKYTAEGALIPATGGVAWVLAERPAARGWADGLSRFWRELRRGEVPG